MRGLYIHKKCMVMKQLKVPIHQSEVFGMASYACLVVRCQCMLQAYCYALHKASVVLTLMVRGCPGGRAMSLPSPMLRSVARVSSSPVLSSSL